MLDARSAEGDYTESTRSKSRSGAESQKDMGSRSLEPQTSQHRPPLGSIWVSSGKGVLGCGCTGRLWDWFWPLLEKVGGRVLAAQTAFGFDLGLFQERLMLGVGSACPTAHRSPALEHVCCTFCVSVRSDTHVHGCILNRAVICVAPACWMQTHAGWLPHSRVNPANG